MQKLQKQKQNMLPSTIQFGFGKAYQLVHDFPILYCCCYSPFVEMLYKQFKVPGVDPGFYMSDLHQLN